MVPRQNWKWVHAFLAANWLLNGLWMVLATAHWFATMPQATQTGPLNEHFTRDYGTVFMLIGAGQLWTLSRGTFTRTVHVWVLLFFAAHALTHVWDIATGHIGHEHLTSGFPLVMLPVLLLSALLHPACWQAPKGR
jgi:hypothetical protein